jgi:hypothetical protein
MVSVQELELVMKPHESGWFYFNSQHFDIILTHVVSTISDSVKVTFLQEINLKKYKFYLEL